MSRRKQMMQTLGETKVLSMTQIGDAYELIALHEGKRKWVTITLDKGNELIAAVVQGGRAKEVRFG